MNIQTNESCENHCGDSLVPADGAGWLTSNSHPAKSDSKVPPVPEQGRVLAAGFDTLNLTVDLSWVNGEFFKYLDGIKERALSQEAAMQAHIEVKGFLWVFNVEPFGMRGYSYVLHNRDYLIKLGRWLQPQSRPSALIEIRSQALWLEGVIECIDRIIEFLEQVGAKVTQTKASRVDACLDILLPAKVWNTGLKEHRLCRSHSLTTYENHHRLTGFTIGKGELRARLYDKPEEIRVKSKSTWLFDVWQLQLQDIPPDSAVARIEFQLRREILRELGVDTIWDLVNHPRSLWAYCTSKWLKFQTDPTLHFDQRQLMPWWRSVQDGFHGSQGANPLLRAKIVQADKKKLAQQFIGQFSSLIAIDCNTDTPRVRLEEHIPLLPKSAKMLGIDDDLLSDRVERKVAKFKRGVTKFKTTQELRKSQGLPQINVSMKSKATEEEPYV